MKILCEKMKSEYIEWSQWRIYKQFNGYVLLKIKEYESKFPFLLFKCPQDTHKLHFGMRKCVLLLLEKTQKYICPHFALTFTKCIATWHNNYNDFFLADFQFLSDILLVTVFIYNIHINISNISFCSFVSIEPKKTR